MENANSFTHDAYSFVNLRLGWDGKFGGVYAFARNVFDERAEIQGSTFAPGVRSVIISRGRVLGVGATVRW